MTEAERLAIRRARMLQTLRERDTATVTKRRVSGQQGKIASSLFNPSLVKKK